MKENLKYKVVAMEEFQTYNRFLKFLGYDAWLRSFC